MSLGHRVEADLGDGRKFIFEAGGLARQANGACMVTLGETMVLGACVSAPAREDIDFFPLTVDYREKMSAAGRFPGGFIKREGRPTTKEILTSRLCDRPVRPLFPDGFFVDLQVHLNVFSADQIHDPDIVAMNAASAALMVSDLPFQGPVGSVRIGLIGDRFVVCPTSAELKESRLDLVLSGTRDGVIMVEAGAREVTEEQMVQAFEAAMPPIRALIDAQLRLRELAGRPPGQYEIKPFPEALASRIRERFLEEMRRAFFIKIKRDRNQAFQKLRERVFEEMIPRDERGEPLPEAPSKVDVTRAYDRVLDELVRSYALEGKRADGRGLKEIRPISIQLGLLPRTHGSALFTRGETQALCTTTLGTKQDEQIVEGLEEEYSERFMLHYNFPSFSVGEVKPIRGPGRREIGHGALAQRALEAVMPPEEEFPYTVRVMSDILESNGSSSMATVCGGCLALMDAGVPIKAPVAGIAMGLVREQGKVAILTDILGSEDAHGDMDFKVAGTEKGITALQMDLKAAGIPMEITRQALADAREARLFVLARMREAIAEPRKELSAHAPRLVRIMIPPDKIGLLIGPGGKTIRDIEARTGCVIEISEDDSGEVVIASKDKEALDRCRAIIEGMTQELKVGAIYPARVVSLKEFGAFCEIAGTGQDGLVHVTEITDQRGIQVADFLKVGMEVEVKMLSADPQGRNRFSIKAARAEKGLPPLQPLNGGQPSSAGAPAPAGAAGSAGGGEQRFRESRPPRPSGGGGGGGGRPPRREHRGPRRDS
ncbi:MAG TPA: polyribonucleotide nucleotidyltransferase [Planctomycetota bacterium]|jgi:polyribonucleotide nucleotidyltransferase|nr:polyribonucleotide nucleotidyltransferase [Planctomycetota bacterium]